MTDLPPTEVRSCAGLWDALERTAVRSKEGEFNPSSEDWKLINRCICLPVARSYDSDREIDDLTSEMINGNPCHDGEEKPRFSDGLADGYRKALECSSIKVEEGLAKDKAVARYCKRCCMNVLLNGESSSFRKMLRERLFRAIRDCKLLVEKDKIVELRDFPRRPLFRGEAIAQLAQELGHRVPRGSTQEYPHLLPTAGQLGALVEQALRVSTKSFLVDDIIELARRVFDVRTDSEPRSLDEPIGEDEDVSTLHDIIPSPGAERQIGQRHDIDLIVARIIEFLRVLDRGQERCLTHKSYFRTFFEFWAWKDEKLGVESDSPKVTATAYSLKAEIADSTLDSWSKKIFSKIRGLEPEYDRTTIGAALGRLKAENVELFRKFWDLSP